MIRNSYQGSVGDFVITDPPTGTTHEKNSTTPSLPKNLEFFARPGTHVGRRLHAFRYITQVGCRSRRHVAKIDHECLPSLSSTQYPRMQLPEAHAPYTAARPPCPLANATKETLAPSFIRLGVVRGHSQLMHGRTFCPVCRGRVL